MDEGTPRLGACCDPDRQRRPFTHETCGGWWCICPCHDKPIPEPEDRSGLVDVEWRQVGGAVYAGDRVLFHGTVPTTRAAKENMVAFLERITVKAHADWVAMREAVLDYRTALCPACDTRQHDGCFGGVCPCGCRLRGVKRVDFLQAAEDLRARLADAGVDLPPLDMGSLVTSEERVTISGRFLTEDDWAEIVRQIEEDEG